ncbi:unnamed protein product [Leuciscus chuanchicus]
MELIFCSLAGEIRAALAGNGPVPLCPPQRGFEFCGYLLQWACCEPVKQLHYEPPVSALLRTVLDGPHMRVWPSGVNVAPLCALETGCIPRAYGPTQGQTTKNTHRLLKQMQVHTTDALAETQPRLQQDLSLLTGHITPQQR